MSLLLLLLNLSFAAVPSVTVQQDKDNNGYFYFHSTGTEATTLSNGVTIYATTPIQVVLNNGVTVYFLTPQQVSQIGITTITYNGISQPVYLTLPVSTITFNGTAQPVYTMPLTTTTFNGTSQPSYVTNTTTITHNGVSQPFYLTLPVSTVTFNSVAQPVYTMPLTTTTFNGVSQPHYQTNVTTITHNGISQPVYLTLPTSTVTLNGVALPSGNNNIGTVNGSTVAALVGLVQSGVQTLTSGNLGFPTLDPYGGIWVSSRSSISLGTGVNKTMVDKVGSLTTTAVTANQAILSYTVTSGKTFYLQRASIQARFATISATATNLGVGQLQIPSGTAISSTTFVNPTTSMVNSPFVLDFAEPSVATSGVVARWVATPLTTTAINWIGEIHGYER